MLSAPEARKKTGKSDSRASKMPVDIGSLTSSGFIGMSPNMREYDPICMDIGQRDSRWPIELKDAGQSSRLRLTGPYDPTCRELERRHDRTSLSGLALSGRRPVQQMGSGHQRESAAPFPSWSQLVGLATGCTEAWACLFTR